jgi:putative effector of murein hydrolase LrgA (UPF0299 family)
VLVYFGVIGFAIAWCLFALGLYVNQPTVHLSPALDELTQYLFLLFCPPSFGLMATDNAKGLMLFFVMFMIAVENAVVYVVVAAIARVLWRRLTSAT